MTLDKTDWEAIAYLIEEKLKDKYDKFTGVTTEAHVVQKWLTDREYFMDLKMRVKEVLKNVR